jgi:hypothetical protein
VDQQRHHRATPHAARALRAAVFEARSPCHGR